MLNQEEMILMRIFVGENDRHHGRPLYEVILEEARKALAAEEFPVGCVLVYEGRVVAAGKLDTLKQGQTQTPEQAAGSHRAAVDAWKAAEVARVRNSGLAEAIPLYVRFHARGNPIVGTSLDYFSFRGLPQIPTCL